MAEKTQDSAIVIDGHALSNQLIAAAAQRLREKAKGRHVLATVLVGDHKQSKLYVGLKIKRAKEAGLFPRLVALPEDTSQTVLNQTLSGLSEEPDVRGILLQLPLPAQLNTSAALEHIAPDKDVDGLTCTNLGALVRGHPGLVPCTPLGVMRILEHHAIPTRGKRAVVVGRSYLAGLPMVLLLARKGVDATVSLCHSVTENLTAETRRADILISCAGIPRLIGVQHVKPGAAVVDVGVSVDKSGAIVGDVDFPAVQKVAGWITPMPGGTGPMTVACLIENTVEQAIRFCADTA